ncbi:MAG: sodium:calcium antiporter [Lysobacterales bacterium]
MEFLLLITGLLGLWIGTELTISGALSIAKRLSLSEFLVGAVILSIGSDLPELAIAVDAGIKNNLGGNASGVVVGTTIGSIIGQIGFVLGVTGLLGYLVLPRRYIFRHGAVLLGANICLFLTALDGTISRTEGLMLITMYVVYMFALLRGERAHTDQRKVIAENRISPWVLLVVGLIVVMGSSELTVESVLTLANRLHINEAFISIVIIGLGSSLPELSISVSAIMKGKAKLSVGNIIGSNILDTLLPIGVTAVISPLLFDRAFLLFDLPFIFLLTVVTLALFVRVRGLQKKEAGIVLALYLLYLLIKFIQL